MPIQAQGTDDVIHEFPDGTPPEAIDRAMKKYAQETAPGHTPGLGEMLTGEHGGKSFPQFLWDKLLKHGEELPGRLMKAGSDAFKGSEEFDPSAPLEVAGAVAGARVPTRGAEAAAKAVPKAAREVLTPIAKTVSDVPVAERLAAAGSSVAMGHPVMGAGIAMAPHALNATVSGLGMAERAAGAAARPLTRAGVAAGAANLLRDRDRKSQLDSDQRKTLRAATRDDAPSTTLMSANRIMQTLTPSAAAAEAPQYGGTDAGRTSASTSGLAQQTPSPGEASQPGGTKSPETGSTLSPAMAGQGALPLPGQSPGLSKLPTTGEAPIAATNKAGKTLMQTYWDHLLEGTKEQITKPREAYRHGLSLEEETQWGAGMGLNILGGGTSFAQRGALGAAGGKPWAGAVGTTAAEAKASDFHGAIGEAKGAHPSGAAVYQYTPEEYAGMKTYMTADKSAGYAVKGDDIVSVFKHPKSPHEGVANSLLPQAIAAGGRRLDAFDTVLPRIYGNNGFRAVARVKWDEAQAPKDWDKTKTMEYNGGEPDVVFMVYDPYRPGYHAGQGKMMGYDEAVKLQKQETARIGEQMKKGEEHFDTVARQVTGLKGVKQYLTPRELETVSAKSVKDLVDMFRTTSPEEMAAVAYSGRAKRGWYKNSAQALTEIFGIADAPRFVGLLAAMSPRVRVEGNTLNALRTWNAWNRAGRPTTREGILAAMSEGVGGAKGMRSVMGAWRNNAVRSLMSADPLGMTLSGPKVDSFWRNLIGRMQEVTNDAWMASYHGVDQDLIGGMSRKDPSGSTMSFKGQSPSYIGMSAMARRAAQVLSKKLGEAWSPAEIQETIWSWAKTLKEKAGAKGAPDPTVARILRAGNISHAEIGATPDFARLFTEGIYRRILEEGGYGKQLEGLAQRSGQRGSAAPSGTPVSEAGPFAGPAFRRHLQRAGRRLDTRVAPEPGE